MPNTYPMPTPEETQAAERVAAEKSPRVSLSTGPSLGEDRTQPRIYPMGEGVKATTSIQGLLDAAEAGGFPPIIIAMRPDGLPARMLGQNGAGLLPYGTHLKQGYNIPNIGKHLLFADASRRQFCGD